MDINIDVMICNTNYPVQKQNIKLYIMNFSIYYYSFNIRSNKMPLFMMIYHNCLNYDLD